MVLFMSRTATGAGVTLTWTATGDDHSVGTATRYDLRYSVNVIKESNWASASKATTLPYPAESGSHQIVWVGNLVLGRRYYFAIKVADEKNNWSRLSNVVAKVATAGCVGMVGNVDCDPQEFVSMSDLTVLISYLFIDVQPLGCPEEANVDGDPEGMVTMSDVTFMIAYLFMGVDTLPACPGQ
jgi:hypothetical protein